MSILLMGRVFYTDLPSNLRLTMLALADFADDDGGSLFVGQRHLGLRIGAGERTVRSNISKLVAIGYLLPEDRIGQHGTKRYQIDIAHLPNDVDIRDLKAAIRNSRPADMAGRESLDRKQTAALDRKPTAGLDRKQASYYPSEEPSDEPSVKSLAPAPPTRRAADAIFEVLALLDGFDFNNPAGRRPNDDERGKLNRSTRLVRQSVGEDAAALRDAIAAWPEVMTDALCTARGVSTNIGRLLAAADGRVFRANVTEGDIARLRRVLDQEAG